MPKPKAATRAEAKPAPVPATVLDDAGQAVASRLRAIVAARTPEQEYTNETSGIPIPEYDSGCPQESVQTDLDGEAVAARERLVRHGLDAIAGVLLPDSLVALQQVLKGTHPAGPKGSASVNGAAKLVFDALRMTGSHVIDRDRTKGADALTVAELEAEVSRTKAAIARKLDAARVVSTQPSADPAPKA